MDNNNQPSFELYVIENCLKNRSKFGCLSMSKKDGHLKCYKNFSFEFYILFRKRIIICFIFNSSIIECT